MTIIEVHFIPLILKNKDFSGQRRKVPLRTPFSSPDMRFVQGMLANVAIDPLVGRRIDAVMDGLQIILHPLRAGICNEGNI